METEGPPVSRLTRLRGKLRKRQDSLKHHSIEFDRHHKKGRKLRAVWHRVRIKADKRALKKLKRLVRREADRVAEQRVNWNGLPALSHPPLVKAAKVALTVDGLYITSTTGGTHSPTSWHYSGRAFDAGSGGPGETPEIRAQEKLLREFGASYFAELFGPAPWYVKNGVTYGGTFPGHHDHLHVAVA